ncbi:MULTISPECIES: hypothetical protein [Carboxydothermus]|uniref:Uncharacterized protein n=2 Tax=Carboxydothermus TaxID=129957 RepID=Q3AC94_CARHZ|nr:MULTISPECIES: hypothetical protein [Carboxydothermus]ABB14609.1 hypothetical protein CHY_1408 [Carboxydothermus hydrogenoformans Z-2901]NYE58177.1 hypothetical protein [Carboxydothermus ferrireducens DSM 11255]
MRKSDKLRSLRTRLLDRWAVAENEERLNLLVRIMDIEEEMGLSFISQKQKKSGMPRKAKAI